MKFKVQVANFVYGIAFNTAFRTSYSPKSLRRNFEWLAGASVRALQRKYPKVTWESWKVGQIEVETVNPGGEVRAHIFYAHGGGYLMGSINGYRRNMLRLAYRCKAKVTTFNYRLAPENPYPAAVEDSTAVYRALLVREKTLPLIGAGDSAGGGLICATLMSLRDSKTVLPKGLFVISPYLDLTGTQNSMVNNHGKDKWLSKHHIESWAPLYSGSYERNHPLVSPVFGEVRGFPPTLILVGDQEVLLDDSTRLDAKLKEQKIASELVIGKDMQHAWMLSLPFLEESKRAMKLIPDFVKRCAGG